MNLLDTSMLVVETTADMDLESLRVALVEASASIAAAQARLAQAMAVFRARRGELEGSGFTSFGQWASVDLGLSSRAATGLADSGDALAERPTVRAAWEAGTLSTAKARCVLGVATDASEATPTVGCAMPTPHRICHWSTPVVWHATPGSGPCSEGADGTAVDLGRSQRLVSDKQRRLLTARDHGCRFPGCTNIRYVDVHHVVEWEDGGPTDMGNLILLCSRHHRLVHHGSFRIDADGDQGLVFIDRFGQPIRPPGRPARHRCPDVPGNPRARSGGDPRYSVDLAVTAMASAS